MSLLNFIKGEFSGWSKYEKILFPLGILTIISLSVIMKDSKIALVSAICGISYTILAGKGKISCYFIGMTGTLCYAYISFKNAFYGNLLLYMCYYLPMQIIGVFQWRKHLKKEKQEIVKTGLSPKERLIYFTTAFIGTIIVSYLLQKAGDQTPLMDAFTTVFSILGMVLTVKRCIDQWIVWTAVNAFSLLMWIKAYINGSNCFATILMWGTYLLLGIYFLYTWQKELSEKTSS